MANASALHGDRHAPPAQLQQLGFEHSRHRSAPFTIDRYSLGAHAEDRPALVGAGLGVAGLWATVIASGQIDVQSFLFSGGLIVATPWLAGRATRSRMLRMAMLEREQRQRERVAVGEERARIARELHDVVAHSVGAMVARPGRPARARP